MDESELDMINTSTVVKGMLGFFRDWNLDLDELK